MIEWLNDWILEWLSDWMIECINQWVNDWMSGWMIECKIPLTDGTQEGFSIGKTWLQIQWINQENRTPTGRVALYILSLNLEILKSLNPRIMSIQMNGFSKLGTSMSLGSELFVGTRRAHLPTPSKCVVKWGKHLHRVTDTYTACPQHSQWPSHRPTRMEWSQC